jgi:hypothetical protein
MEKSLEKEDKQPQVLSLRFQQPPIYNKSGFLFGPLEEKKYSSAQSTSIHFIALHVGTFQWFSKENDDIK